MAIITSCATLGFAGFDVETAVAQIANRGFNHVEITELGSYCRHFPFQQATPAELSALLDRYGLQPVAMNVSASRLLDGEIFRPRLSIPEEASRVVDYARWFLEQAAVLNIPVVSFPLGPRVTAAVWEDEMKRSVEQYRIIADLALSLGLSLNLEVPHLFQLTDSVEHTRRVFTELDHPAVGATVDSSHWGILRYDLDDFFSFLGPRLRHVHLRDSAGVDTADFKQDLERTPGCGTVDFRAFGEALDRFDYAGEISLELECRHTDLESIEHEFDAGIAYLRGCGWRFPEGV